VGDFSLFVDHVRQTDLLGAKLIRAPRTHDGILLRSGLLGEVTKSQLVSVATSFGIDTRIIRGIPYELNCSLPYLFSKGVSGVEAWWRIELAVAISSFISGWCFLYLPMLIGHVPETDNRPVDQASTDPRSLNRRPIPYEVWSRFARSAEAISIQRLLLHVLKAAHDKGVHGKVVLAAPLEFGGRLLIVRRPLSRMILMVNGDTSKFCNIEALVRGRLVAGWRATTREISPLGFGFWHY
jgi:hypothetical protein